MSTQEPILFVGEEPEGKHAQKLKLELVELTQRKQEKKEPYIELKENGCWLWLRKSFPSGYGVLGINKKSHRAHRYLYEKIVGNVPENMELDHLCRNKLCVNPEHLEPVTHKENVLRGESFSAINARKTHCKHGHEFTENNIRRIRGGRECQTCRRIRKKIWKIAKRAEKQKKLVR